MNLSYRTLQTNNERKALQIMLLIAVVSTIGLLLYGPIPQDPAYHQFADHRTLLGIDNFWNVASNLPLAFIGLIGVFHIRTGRINHTLSQYSEIFHLFFIGILLTGLSSAYYHYFTDNHALAWDRLAMSIGFMAFLDLTISAFVDEQLGKRLLLPLFLSGLCSVLYWSLSENLGTGDLRPYALVQFLPLIFIGIIISLTSCPMINKADIVIIGSSYIVAKILEFADYPIFAFTGISGHSLKHMAAAYAAYRVLLLLNKNINNNRNSSETNLK